MPADRAARSSAAVSWSTTFARFLKFLAVLGSIGTLVMSHDFLMAPERRKFEYPVLILLATAGMLMLISATDLIALYLGLELMSLALYVIAAIRSRQCPLDRSGP